MLSVLYCNSWSQTVVVSGKVVVYGSNLDVYCCVQTLLQAGIPGNDIVIVEPPQPQVICPFYLHIYKQNIMMCQTISKHVSCLSLFICLFTVNCK